MEAQLSGAREFSYSRDNLNIQSPRSEDDSSEELNLEIDEEVSHRTQMNRIGQLSEKFLSKRNFNY